MELACSFEILAEVHAERDCGDSLAEVLQDQRCQTFCIQKHSVSPCIMLYIYNGMYTYIYIMVYVRVYIYIIFVIHCVHMSDGKIWGIYV